MATVVVQNGIRVRIHCGSVLVTISADRPVEYSEDYGATWKRLEPEHNAAVKGHVIVRKPE